MQNNRFRTTLDIWIARIGSVIGWIFLVLWALMGVVGLGQLPKAKDGSDFAAMLVCFGLAAVHFLLIRAMKKTKDLVKDFRLYSSVLAQIPDKSIPAVAEALKIPQETVMRRMQEMCGRGYFNGHINFMTSRMEMNVPAGLSVEHCPGCGAVTAISRTGDTCRYCGAPLVRTNREVIQNR